MADTKKILSAKPVLELSTLLDGLTITIDRKPYRIRHPDVLSVGDYTQVKVQIPEIGELLDKAGERTPEEEGAFDRLTAQVCTIVLDAPPGLRKKLKPLQRAAIVTAFLTLRPALRQLVGAFLPDVTPNRSIGASGSRGSRASTAAARKTGDGGSRSA